MLLIIIRFLNILLSGIIAGILFGIWKGYNPQYLTAPAYIEQQQGAIRALNTFMPILGLITIVITIISAFLQRDNHTLFAVLIAGAVLLVISGLVTRFGNQPINAIVMTWDKSAVPNNWEALRDKWWYLHAIRTIASFLAFCLVSWASMSKN